MICIYLSRDCNGRIVAFRVKGHAGYGPHGNDVICAAVSVLTQTAVIGLEDHLGLQPEVVVETGLLECRLRNRPAAKEAEIDAILETMALGVVGVAREHPGSVRIIEGEVE